MSDPSSFLISSVNLVAAGLSAVSSFASSLMCSPTSGVADASLFSTLTFAFGLLRDTTALAICASVSVTGGVGGL